VLFRSDVEKGERSYTEGLKKGASPQGSAALGLSLGRGDFMQELHASRRKELSKLGGVGMAASLAMDIGIGGATLSDLDLTGQMSEVERQHDVFFAAKKAKIIEDDVDFRQYMAKSQEEKLGILGQTTAALKDRAGRGDQTSQKMLDRIGGEMETGLMQTRDIQAARDQFGKQVDQLLTDEFGGFGSSVFGGKQSKLAQTLTKSGKARASYDGYMRELLKGGGRDDQALMAYEEKLKEEFGEDSPEYRAIQSQRTKLEKDPAALERFKKAYEGPGGMGQLFTDRALIEKVHKDSEGLRKRVSGINMENIRDPGLRATVAKLGAAAGKGDIEGRTSAMSDLILGSISGGISDEERRVLSEVGGAGQGEQVASFVSALQTGKVSKGDQAMLKEAGFDEAKIKEIAKLQGEEQAEAIKKVFQEAGLTDLAMFQSSEGAADKRGVQTQYVDANKDFVLAVHAFVSALGSVKGIDLPAIPGPSAKLTEGGSSPSGGNT
ncbi:MAG TPA: hypothetical protein VLA34_08870, partial [Candidatus Krumholzibacterium sp.]|nr:hypothetical protein [Candidatus Krumholzibacterium sp.]